MFPQFLSRGYICRRKHVFETSSMITKRNESLPGSRPDENAQLFQFDIIAIEYIGRRLIYLLRVYIKYCFVTAERVRLSNQGGVNDRDQFVFCRKTLSRGDRVGIFVPAALCSLRSTLCMCSSCNKRTKPPCCTSYTESVCSKQHLNFTRRKKLFILK